MKGSCWGAERVVRAGSGLGGVTPQGGMRHPPEPAGRKVRSVGPLHCGLGVRLEPLHGEEFTAGRNPPRGGATAEWRPQTHPG